ncbi:MAG: hypothetical protein WC791_01435 [Candidatus Paceibacterota bacterium]|jgi:hypothetical protein
MSKNENRTQKIIIGIFSAIFAGCLFVAFKDPEFSGLFIFFATVFFVVILFLVSYRGRCLGLGTIAEEKDLDKDVSYRIGDIVKTRGRRLLFLDGSPNYETEVVMEPRNGFEKFEILDDQYLAPKKLKAKVVNGSLWTPVK